MSEIVTPKGPSVGNPHVEAAMSRAIPAVDEANVLRARIADLESQLATKVPNLMVPQPVVLADIKPGLKLDLAAGQNVREGFEGVDIWEGSKHVVNLMEFPWPWADNSVEELHCSHFVEHIPMGYLNPDEEKGSWRRITQVPLNNRSKDLFFAFFDECWRIMRPGAHFTVICPSLKNHRAFQDPTHRRFYPAETFQLYLMKAWREANKLDHYNVKCDFCGLAPGTSPQCDFSFDVAENARAQEVQFERFKTMWNLIGDWIVRMRAVK